MCSALLRSQYLPFIAIALIASLGIRAEGLSEFLLLETNLVLRQVDLSAALKADSLGYPRLDSSKVDLSKTVDREHEAVVLENRYFRATVLPKMGRLFSFFDKLAGHEQLWTNQIARPLFNQKNELGWWMVWGGVEYVIPAGEHGTTWALKWRYEIVENSVKCKALRMTVTDPNTKLEQTVQFSIFPRHAALQTEISVLNHSADVVRFSHWVNPMWAPGGRNEITPETEFIVPSERMIVADRDFNAWMLGQKVQELRRNPLRFAKNWRSIGDLLSGELTNGFYSAFSHEAGSGIARVFDHRANPGMNIWTWGFQPPPERQREYSLTPNLGYVEMWGGTAQDFSDASLNPIAPGEKVQFVEWMYSYRQTQGLAFATRDVAVNFAFDPSAREHLQLHLCAIRPLTNLNLNVTLSNGQSLWNESVDLVPDSVFTRRFKIPPARREAPILVARHSGEELIRIAAQPVSNVEWGGQFMPQRSD